MKEPKFKCKVTDVQMQGANLVEKPIRFSVNTNRYKVVPGKVNNLTVEAIEALKGTYFMDYKFQLNDDGMPYGRPVAIKKARYLVEMETPRKKKEAKGDGKENGEGEPADEVVQEGNKDDKAEEGQ